MTKLIEDMNRKECHWPTDEKNDDRRTLYCADPCIIGSEYCGHHHRMMYNSEQARRRHQKLLPLDLLPRRVV